MMQILVNTDDSFVIFLSKNEHRLLKKRSYKRGVTEQTVIRRALGVVFSGRCDACNVSLLFK